MAIQHAARARGAMTALLAAFALAGCATDWVRPKPTNRPIYPQVSVFTPPDGNGWVSESTVTSSGASTTVDVHVKPNSQLSLGATAGSGQGVKRLELVSPSGQVVAATGAPRSDGAVPARLVIPGTDGNGGPGGGRIPFDVGCDGGQARAHATTFRGDEAQLLVTYVVDAPQQTADLTASKLEVSAGETIKLNWTTTNADSVSVDGVGPSVAKAGSTNIKIDQDTMLGMTAHAACRADVFASVTITIKGEPAPVPTGFTGTVRLESIAGAQTFSTPIVLSGTVKAAAANAQGAGSFTMVTVTTANIIGSGLPQDFPFVANLGLKKGTWDVTLQPIPGVTNASLTCTTQAPGNVVFDPGNDQRVFCH